MKIRPLLGAASVAVTLAITPFAANAQGPGRGKGMPAEARETIHQLFDSHEKFHREVKITAEGYVSKTTSNDPAAVDLLQAHVKQMEERLEQGRMVRRWDPAFEELVEHYDDIEIEVAKIEDGISVTAEGTTDAAKKVVRNHADIISQFIKNGWSEHDKTHPEVAGETSGPARKGRGKPCKKFAGASENGNSREKPLTESQREQSVVIGERASTSLMKSLGAQLKGALSGGDPSAAVRVCQQVAQPITTSAAEQFSGIAVSRTSLKTRNPANAPDDSDRPILEKWQALADDGKSLPEHEVVRGDGETVIYYRPIMVQEVCVKCHGDSEKLTPGLRSVLDSLYPDDNARGYEAGDFRGVFRVTIDLATLEQGAEQAR